MTVTTLVAAFGAAFIAAASLAGCKPPGPAPGADAPKPGSDRIPVEVANVELRTLNRAITGSATIESEAQVAVFPRATGPISELKVEETHRVAAGQLLAQVDDRDAKLLLERAELQLDQQRANLKRLADLEPKGFVTPQQMDDAKFASRAAEVAVSEARRRLEDTRIVAPVAGTITARNLSLGSMANPGQQAFVVTDLSRLKVVLSVPEKDIARLVPGQLAEISPLALPGVALPATVSLINPSVDPASGTVRVVLKLARDERARPGMFVRAAIKTEKREQAPAIARRSLVYEGQKPFVYKLAPQAGGGFQAQRVVPGLGIEDGDFIEVTEGLTAQDRVVAMGQNGLRDGAVVEVLNAEAVGLPVPAASPTAQVQPGATTP